MPPASIAGVLRAAGVEFDAHMPVVYAAPCPFRGRRIAHLVVQTAHGPMTVMLLPHVKVRAAQEFSEDGLPRRVAAGGEPAASRCWRAAAAVPEDAAGDVVSGGALEREDFAARLWTAERWRAARAATRASPPRPDRAG